MKTLLYCLLFSFISITGKSQQQTKKALQFDSTKKLQIVETACGQCKFKLPGKNCDLAVRINGKAYFVEGTSIDEHGDAHAKDGFCNAKRKVEVQGEINKEKFVVSYFKLIKEMKKN